MVTFRDIVESGIPSPSAKEVQVQVEFSGFSDADINMRRRSRTSHRIGSGMGSIVIKVQH
jgi:hypothetical protein